ncbi:MAG: hypothetical protein GXO91_03200 [FCB group bacterium]|nr:hypothetical protein [FCB group bacterium]
MLKTHSFHIPVMGIGFTIDTPLKVAQYGIDSVISLVDDMLLEKLRKFYCSRYDVPYQEITDDCEDFRAKRITSYLDLVNDIAHQKFSALKNSAHEKSAEFKEYFNLLPEGSSLKSEFKKITSRVLHIDEITTWIKDNLSMGSIDVNIMTKVDKDNYRNSEKLPVEYNDAHAALRGFANSKLRSSIILSAGMNPRLYGYMENFDDFFPDETAQIKKKIVLKVSDYRSAFIQGKFLAKKGLWVSEYRVESGLNCGGHSFPTEGILLGPVLAEFRDKREELRQSIHNILVKALSTRNRPVPEDPLELRITAQGGVGTADEHQFLLEHYALDSVGWATPFLLASDVTTVDEGTIQKLIDAREEDLYLSDTSPLGVPFNSLRGNTKDQEKKSYIESGKPGSPCPKKYVALNNEFTRKSICTASRQYQYLKIKELKAENLPREEYRRKYDQIIDKSCLCVGLGTSALLVNQLDTRVEGDGVSVCPGPNMAYFSRKLSLKEIVDHIYGRTNVISRTDRPNLFIKELKLYLDYLKNKIEETRESFSQKKEQYLLVFSENLQDSIAYYDDVFSSLKEAFKDKRTDILNELNSGKETLQALKQKIRKLALRQLSA